MTSEKPPMIPRDGGVLAITSDEIPRPSTSQESEDFYPGRSGLPLHRIPARVKLEVIEALLTCVDTLVGGYPGWAYWCGDEVVIADYDPGHAAPTLTVYRRRDLIAAFDALWRAGLDDPDASLNELWVDYAPEASETYRH